MSEILVQQLRPRNCTVVVACLIAATAAYLASADEEPFRPVAGTFPPLDQALAYRGELVFVDHANRRGSVRIEGKGTYFRNAPHPFALLPYAVVRYHNAPADLRDIPLGTVVHIHAFLPPDPTTSAVPVLPIDNRKKTSGYSGAGIAPAENHVLLFEDEPSHCERNGLVWKLKQLEINNLAGKLVASRVPKHEANANDAQTSDADHSGEDLTFDAATRIWRGRECLSVADLVAEETWPASGKQSLNDQPVLLGITWKPTTSSVFTRFHVSDIWLDETAAQRASQTQTETHKAFIRSRWMPAWIDHVDYGKFGRATITATLFGGMDESLYDDFKDGVSLAMNASENTLKHAGGNYGPAHMASKGKLLKVTRADKPAPVGSSGIQIEFETDLIIEGIRPGRVVRVRPSGWPDVNLPREEYLGDGSFGHEARFPTPAIFPTY